jgi:hypothetical protein
MSPKQTLWERWGDPAFPAEWDGHGGNGGKGSQRFWEYLWVLDKIGHPQSVLDVGGGTGFFADLLMDSGVPTKIIDPLASKETDYRCSLSEFIDSSVMSSLNFDWIASLSVLEHVEDKDAFCADLDSFNAPIAMTFEFGPGCIEIKEVYRCLSSFKRHHLTLMEICPVWADNSSPDKWRPMGLVLDLNQ